MNASDQSVSARYEFSPYGELLRATGPLATANPFRWSTKFWDEESGLVYYGYRYYDPDQGRWLGRDPIAEEGGLNLYAFVANNPHSAVDPLGKWLLDVLITNSGESTGRAVQLERGNSLLSRVRGVIRGLDNLQEFSSGVLDAGGMDISGLLDSLDAAKGLIATGLRGSRSASKASEDLHHIFPKAKMFRNFFMRNNVNANGVLMKIDWVLHQRGIHTPRNSDQHSALNPHIPGSTIWKPTS